MPHGCLVTGTRLERWGYVLNPKCTFCGALDTPQHRAFGPCPKGAEGRAFYADACAAAGKDELLSRLLVARPRDLPLPVQDWTFKYWSVEDGGQASRIEFDPLLTIFTDASCVLPKHLGLARAGVAAVQLDKDNQLIRAVVSPIPSSFPQAAIHLSLIHI